MKRETKLGLLIGIALILLISVVVTDYLATPSNQQPADMTTFAPAAEQSVIGRTADNVRSWLHQQTNDQPDTTATHHARQPIPLPEDNPRQPLPRERQTTTPSHTTETQPRPEIQRPAGFGSVAEGESYRPYENPAAVSERELPENTAVRTNPVIHVVSSGENLYKIAKRYYGNGEYWRSIAQANREIDNDKGIIIPGQKVVIPNLAGRVTDGSAQPRITAVANNTPSQTRSTAPQLMRITRTRKSVIVQSGDSLSRIAERELGDRKLWRLILEANRNQLSDPNQIRPGMELKLPTVERRETVTTSTAAPATPQPTTTQRNSIARPALGATVPVRREVTRATVRPEQLATFTAQPAAASVTRPSPFAGSRTYTVKSGDTLASIARRFYKDHEQWRRIFDANRTQLGDPNDLLVGDVLIIPGR